MAEKQNSSGMQISTSEDRRTTSLPPLSEIIKSQTSIFQRRSANTKSSKLPTGGGGFKTFLMKVIVGAGAVYFSAVIGVWGEPTESAKVAQKVKDLIRRVGDEKMLSEEFRGDVVSRLNETTTHLKTQMEGIPDALKAYYDETEKYVNDLIKRKKS